MSQRIRAIEVLAKRDILTGVTLTPVLPNSDGLRYGRLRGLKLSPSSALMTGLKAPYKNRL